jgi:hypothetical protein
VLRVTDGQLDPTQAVPVPDPGPDATQVWQTGPQGPLGPPPGGPPGGPPRRPDEPDRRPWILVGVLAAIVAVLILILLLQRGDDDDGDTVAGGSTTTSSVVDSTTSAPAAPSTTTTTEAPTTTTAAPATTLDPADCKAAGAGQAKVGLAAQTVYDAWARNDGGCAHELMTDDAFDELFQRDGTGAQWQFQGCSNEILPQPHADCAFSYEGGATHLLGKFSGGWKFYDIEQVAD